MLFTVMAVMYCGLPLSCSAETRIIDSTGMHLASLYQGLPKIPEALRHPSPLPTKRHCSIAKASMGPMSLARLRRVNYCESDTSPCVGHYTVIVPACCCIGGCPANNFTTDYDQGLEFWGETDGYIQCRDTDCCWSAHQCMNSSEDGL